MTEVAMHASCQVIVYRDCAESHQKSANQAVNAPFSRMPPRICTRRRRRWQATGEWGLLPGTPVKNQCASSFAAGDAHCLGGTLLRAVAFLGPAGRRTFPALVTVLVGAIRRHQALLAAGTGIEQRFQLTHMGGTQLLARQQGLHLLEDAVGWHRRQGGRGGARGDAWRAHRPRLHLRCWPPCRTAGQQAYQQ